jgi:hypothetical protein
MATEWVFHVEGQFVRPRTHAAVSPCTAIVESGERGDGSPFKLKWVRGIARADSNGYFARSFGTWGDAGPVRAPTTIAVFVRVAAGKWLKHVVPIDASQASAISEHEMRLKLVRVEIRRSTKVYVP